MLYCPNSYKRDSFQFYRPLASFSLTMKSFSLIATTGLIVAAAATVANAQCACDSSDYNCLTECGKLLKLSLEND